MQNCVSSASQAVVQKWAKFSWRQKKCHIWLMPYATNFDGCSLINPAEMRQSCPSIREKGVQKIAWKNPLLHRFHIAKNKILDCYQAADKILLDGNQAIQWGRRSDKKSLKKLYYCTKALSTVSASIQPHSQKNNFFCVFYVMIWDQKSILKNRTSGLYWSGYGTLCIHWFHIAKN